jgi:hypothetical protein
MRRDGSRDRGDRLANQQVQSHSSALCWLVRTREAQVDDMVGDVKRNGGLVGR